MIDLSFKLNFENSLNSLLPWEQLSGKNILITGGTGFIGGYLAKVLCWLNHQLSLDLTLYLLHREGTEPLLSGPCIHWIRGDVATEFLPKGFSPHIIIHAASPANQQAISTDPAGVVDCNVLATRYLLENARKHEAKFLFFSSGEVYQRQSGRIQEEHAGFLAKSSILSLYGSSKLAGELLCERYRQKYGVDCCVLRLFSVFGPGESLTSGRCFTDFLRQMIYSNRIVVTGSGTQIRSFCYLSDFVSGLLYVLLKGENTVYNIGNEDNTCSLLELAKEMAEAYGDVGIVGPLGTESCTDSYVPDTTRLRELGWQPQVDLRACIKRCLESYNK